MAAALLDWTADPPGRVAGGDLAAFRSLLLAHWAVQAWAFVVRPLEPPFTFPPLAITAGSVALTILFLLSFTRRARVACALALPLALWLVAWTFPGTPNHTCLAALLLGLCAWLDAGREDDARLLLQALRWVAVIVFFWAGLQKALHGLYFRGEFLAWMVSHSTASWGAVFGWLVPAAEIDRLRSLPRYAVGIGPYRVASWPFLLAANGVWLGEIALALAMLTRRLRRYAALAAIALVFVIQLAPHEFMFALLYTQLLLLFLESGWERRLLPALVLAYAYLLAAALGAPGAGVLVKVGGYL